MKFQQTFACSKETKETLEKEAKYVKSQKKKTRTTSLKRRCLWCLYFQL